MTDGATQERRYIDAAEVAKIVRKVLKTAYPTTKFYVHTDRYANGSSIDVGWRDGPTTDAVERIINQFHGAEFDGMIDLQSYHDSDWKGERVHFGNDYIHCQRRVTDEPELRIIAESVIRKRCATEGTPPYDQFGGDWVTNLAWRMVSALEFPDPNGSVTAEQWDRVFRIAVLRGEDA